MANPNMADHVYSTDPRVVSRFLAYRIWTRSRVIRRTGEHTQGFAVRRVQGETLVEWREDSRASGPGHVAPTRSHEERLTLLAKTLGDRYEVGRRGDTLIVSERVLKPEVLSFYRAQGPEGPEYRAETDHHRYVIRNLAYKRWEMAVWGLGADEKPILTVSATSRFEAEGDAVKHLKRQQADTDISPREGA